MTNNWKEEGIWVAEIQVDGMFWTGGFELIYVAFPGTYIK